MMHRILAAGKETNPSLRVLVRPLLAKPSALQNKILNTLERLHPGWPEIELIWPNLVTYVYLPRLNPRNSQKSASEQREAFWDRINKIRLEWEFLERECKEKLEDIRHDFFAHLELVEQTAESPQEALDRELHTEKGGERMDRPRQYTFSVTATTTFEELWLSVCQLMRVPTRK
jgi:hypothetical protein